MDKIKTKNEKVNLLQTILLCSDNTELIKQFNRLTGNKLGCSINRTIMEKMIDESTGYEKEINKLEKLYLKRFIVFCKETIWDRLPIEAKELDILSESILQLINSWNITIDNICAE